MFSRRTWIKSSLAIPLLTFSARKQGVNDKPESSGSSLKLSLNAYSFNRLLRDGEMTLDQLLDFTADHYIPALDLTAYYFPTYPEVPNDSFLYGIKRKAHQRGLVFSGTGVRNNFTQADAKRRSDDMQLVRNWIDAAVKLGAPMVRIFAGPEATDGVSEREAMNWMIENIRECVEYGAQRGIIVALQNHNEFVKTAEQIHQIMKRINSEWFGLMLDIGSYRMADPYAEITETIPYAVNWQIKENVYEQGEEQKTDLVKLFRIIRDSGYRGYLPLETLGPGDPYQKVTTFLQKAREALDTLS